MKEVSLHLPRVLVVPKSKRQAIQAVETITLAMLSVEAIAKANQLRHPWKWQKRFLWQLHSQRVSTFAEPE